MKHPHRERLGWALVDERDIREFDGYWTISRASNKYLFYRVVLGEKNHLCTCTCSEYQHSKPVWCRHIHAVQEFRRRREAAAKAPPPKELKSPPKKKHARDWKKYNLSAAEEHREFKVLLHKLCERLPTPGTTVKGGRPHIPMPDLVYAAVTKVRMHRAGRKMRSILEDDQERALIGQIPTPSTILGFFNTKEATKILQQLIAETAAPFAGMEFVFAFDLTYMPTTLSHHWHDKITNEPKRKRRRMRAHISTGVLTNIICEIRVTSDRGKKVHESPQFVHVLADTAERFRVLEVIGDSANCTNRAANAVAALGAVFITTTGDRKTGFLNTALTRAVQYQFKMPAFFWKHYLKRNNVETTASMLKKEYPKRLQSRNDRALVNEVLCIALIHNLKRLVRAKYEMGMNVEFWKKRSDGT